MCVDWGVRPLIADLKCRGPAETMDQCTWRHAHDDPDRPSSPILPRCTVHCGDPGRASQTRRSGYDYSYRTPATTVTFECLYDYSSLPAFKLSSLTMTCQKEGEWDVELIRCPAQQSTDLAQNRPWSLSTVDVDLSWLVRSWVSSVAGYQPSQTRCQATTKTTYPYVQVDLIGPVEVQHVTIDFGVSAGRLS